MLTISFNAVINDSSKDAKADFLTVTVWGKQAELAAQYLVKGQHVSIIGSINSFIDKDKKLQFRLNSYDVQFGSKPQLSKNKDQPIENNKGEKEIECSEPEQEPIEPPEEYFSEEPEEEPEV